MMKKIIKLLLLVGLIVYLVFAFIRFNKNKKETECTKVTITVTDADKADFVTVEDIKAILKDTKLDPVGKELNKIHLGKIKKAIDGHQFVLQSLCYSTPKGEVIIEVSQKLPILRVMPNNGEGYYIDAKGGKIPHVQYPADVVVVTGNVVYSKAKPVLATFGQILLEDSFWNDMIEQINFRADGTIELTPRLADHVVSLGKPTDIAKKLARLRTFYEKVMNEVGWNKYSHISLEYNNEVVCTKKETENK